MSSCRGLVSVVKACQRCGTQFGCGLSCCWCDEVTLSADARSSLQAQFSDCLCRACLQEMAASRVEQADRRSR
jgi:hypothetical protein